VISIDGVVQSPGSYTISAATITFDSVMAAASTNNFIYQIGTGLITEPSDDSVTAAKIATDAVTTAKIKDLNVTVGKLPASVDLSTKTITLPATVAGLGTGITNAQLAGSIDVTTKITGVVPTANLGSGSASSSTYLAGDQTYKAIVAVDIAWQSVVTGATLSAVAGRGYPINTTSNACTVTLPASASVGDQIIFSDYLRTWGTNAVTINQNSLKFQGYTTPQPVYDTAGESVHIVYMDATQGWVPINDGAVVFETAQPYDSEYLIIAGGGGGGAGSGSGHGAAGAGAGGYRTNYGGVATALTSGITYTITVGTGGAAAATAGTPLAGSDGLLSSIEGSGFSTIASTGGGGGGSRSAADGGIGRTGGSGGGSATYIGTPAAGNAGGYTPVEGYAGGNYLSGNEGGAGGGGSSAIGVEVNSNSGTAGGAGTANSITGASVTYAGGGGGGSSSSGGAGGAGGSGGGGAGGASTIAGSNATDGLGSGGGGGGSGASGGDGGNGRVILRVATGDVGTPSGEDSSAVDGSDTVITWLVTGSYVA